jgi:hypothetical protein
MNQFYDKYEINHITTPPYHPASNGIIERFVRSFKESMMKEQQSGQTNKFLALREILRAYRWTPHTSTDLAPANMMLRHTIRTELHRMKPYQPTKQKQPQTTFSIGQLVWALKYQVNKRPQWESAVITKVLGSIVYEIQLSNGQRHKRHQNQLRPRYPSNTELTEMDSLPDDLLNTKSQFTTIQSSSSSPRYPHRNRKPPDRYTP